MTDDAPRTVYLLLLLVLVASSLVGMRVSPGKVVKIALAWVAIFAVAFALFAFRGEFGALGSRLYSEATGAPTSEGGEVRIPISEDGHFWVEARINGHADRFLVDSGASVTTISSQTAEAAGISGRDPQLISTANGTVAMLRGRAERLQLADIERRDVAVRINQRDSTNVLGMNFLSSLDGWRVERNQLVLRP